MKEMDLTKGSEEVSRFHDTNKLSSREHIDMIFNESPELELWRYKKQMDNKLSSRNMA